MLGQAAYRQPTFRRTLFRRPRATVRRPTFRRTGRKSGFRGGFGRFSSTAYNCYKGRNAYQGKVLGHIGNRMTLWRQPIPASQFYQCNWFQSDAGTVLATGAVAYNSGNCHVYSANSMNQIDVTGASGKPQTYSQYMSVFYNKFRVMWIDVSITFTTAGAASDLCPYVHWRDSASNSLSGSTFDTVGQVPSCEVMLLSSSGDRRVTYRRRYPIHVILGMSAQEYMGSDSVAHAVGANPSKQAYFEVGLCSPSGVTTEVCTYVLAVNWGVHCYERIDQGAS